MIVNSPDKAAEPLVTSLLSSRAQNARAVARLRDEILMLQTLAQLERDRAGEAETWRDELLSYEYAFQRIQGLMQHEAEAQFAMAVKWIQLTKKMSTKRVQDGVEQWIHVYGGTHEGLVTAREQIEKALNPG